MLHVEALDRVTDIHAFTQIGTSVAIFHSYSGFAAQPGDRGLLLTGLGPCWGPSNTQCGPTGASIPGFDLAWAVLRTAARYAP